MQRHIPCLFLPVLQAESKPHSAPPWATFCSIPTPEDPGRSRHPQLRPGAAKTIPGTFEGTFRGRRAAVFIRRHVAPSPPGEWTPACKCYGHVAPTADSLVPCGPGHCRFATCCVSSWHGRPEWNSRRPAPGTLAGHGAPDGSSEAGFEESSFVGVTAEGSNRICGLFGASEVVQFSKASPQALRLDIYGSFCFIFGTGGQARRCARWPMCLRGRSEAG